MIKNRGSPAGAGCGGWVGSVAGAGAVAEGGRVAVTRSVGQAEGGGARPGVGEVEPGRVVVHGLPAQAARLAGDVAGDELGAQGAVLASVPLGVVGDHGSNCPLLRSGW